MTATVRGHPWPVYGSNRLRAAGRVTARDVPPVVPWLSWKVGCREAPLNHPGDTRLRAQAGDGVDPHGSVAAVPTAQAERECCQTRAGMGAWMGQYLDRVPACLTTAGVARRDEHQALDGLIQRIPSPRNPVRFSWAQCCEPKRFAYNFRVVKKNPHAVEMGRQGGKARTPQKIEAARRNGRKGGRPPTRPHPNISDPGAPLPDDIRASSEDAPGWPLTDKQVGIEE